MSNSLEMLPEIFQNIADQFTEFLNNSDFLNKINLVFGNVNIEQARTLIGDLAGSLEILSQDLSIDLSRPLTLNVDNTSLDLALLSVEFLGANGAFGNNTIYLSANLTDSTVLQDVLIEELGHFLDSKLNTVDAIGDEGQLFSALVQNKVLSNSELTAIQNENDTGILNLNGQSFAVEYANPVATLIRIIDTSQWKNPSGTITYKTPDPAGITYNSLTGTFWIADSEVEEMGIYAGSNLFEMNLQGQVVSTKTTVGKFSNEPTDIYYNPYNGNYFISDDDDSKIYEVDSNFNVLNTLRAYRFNANIDPESAVFALVGGTTPTMFIASGEENKIYTVLPGADGLFNNNGDTFTAFNITGGILDVEGVYFNQSNQHLYLVGNGSPNLIGEYTTDGTLVQLFETSLSGQNINLAGLTFGPSSINPSQTSVYVVARGLDNNDVPSENDGKIYEFSLSGSAPTNTAPIVNAGVDQTTTNLTVSLDGTVQDDGLPNNTLNTLWSVVSKPNNATVTFGNINAIDTTATFSTTGNYVLQLLANDGQLSTNDQININITAIPTNTAPIVNAGVDQTTTNLTVSLDGTVQDDGLPNNTLNTLWSVVSTPNNATVTFGNINAIDTTATFSTTGNYVLQLLANDGQLSTNDQININITTPNTPPPLNNLYFSFERSGTIGGIAYSDEDILSYNQSTQTWAMYFDGSDVGLTASGLDLSGFYIAQDGSILFSVNQTASLPNIGTVDDCDIIRFIPTSLGQNTSGSYQLYFDASAAGLIGEDVDALTLTSGGDLLISTEKGSLAVGGISAEDEDILLYSKSTGTWSIYFDGSDVGLADSGNEDIWAVALDSTGKLYLSTYGAFAVTGVSGDGLDVFTFTPTSLGNNTTGTFNSFWDGSAMGLNTTDTVDGFAFA